MVAICVVTAFVTLTSVDRPAAAAQSGHAQVIGAVQRVDDSESARGNIRGATSAGVISADAPSDSSGSSGVQAAAVPPTPAPTYSFSTGTTSSTNIGIGGSPADSTVGVSRTHVCATARAAFACYTKAGQLVSLGSGFSAQPYTAAAFFKASGITVAAAIDGSTSNTVKDGRIVFDPAKQRFFMVFQSREPTGRHLIAVSKSGNPSDGWWTYADTVATADANSHDYQLVGVTSQWFLVSRDPVCTSTTYCPTTGRKTTINYLYNSAKLANGTGISRGQWSHVDAIRPAPAVHATATTDAFWADSDGLNGGSVWAVRSGTVYRRSYPLQLVKDPPVATQKGGSALDYALIGAGPFNADYRAGKLAWGAAVGKVWSGSSATRNAIRLVRVNLANYFASSPSVTVEIDRVFGKSSDGDAAGAVFDYGFPAVGSNSSGDLVVGSVRSNSTIYPELRASTYLAGQPDISSTRLLKGSTSPLSEFDMAGVSPDQTTSGVYLSQQYGATSPSFRILIAKMLGKTMPDVAQSGVTAPSSAARGSTISVTISATNLGDATMPATTNQLRLSTDSSISTADTLLGSFSLPSIAPGSTSSATFSVTIPAGAASGTHYVGASLDSGSAASENSESNNANPLLAAPRGNRAINLT